MRNLCPQGVMVIEVTAIVQEIVRTMLRALLFVMCILIKRKYVLRSRWAYGENAKDLQDQNGWIASLRPHKKTKLFLV